MEEAEMRVQGSRPEGRIRRGAGEDGSDRGEGGGGSGRWRWSTTGSWTRGRLGQHGQRKEADAGKEIDEAGGGEGGERREGSRESSQGLGSEPGRKQVRVRCRGEEEGAGEGGKMPREREIKRKKEKEKGGGLKKRKRPDLEVEGLDC